MSSVLRKNPNRCSFPFDHLPDEIQSRILALLPITTLVLCKAVSRSWRSLICSPAFTDSYRPSRDPIFLLYCRSLPTLSACAYLPCTDSWIHFRLPQPVSILPTAGTSLLAVFNSDRLYVVNPFSLPHPIDFLPPLHRRYNALALIQDNPSDYIVVATSATDGIHNTQTYDSRSGRWEECGHLRNDGAFARLRNAVYLDGLLFCLNHVPNRLLTFDPVRGQWSMLDLDLPVPSLNFRLLGFGGELYWTGVLQEGMVITRIGIWELDRSAMAWKEFSFMPDKYLAEFRVRELRYLSIIDCKGMVCFSGLDPKEIVMCDMAMRRWWCPQPCNIPGERGFMIGCAFEPHINLLK